MKIFVIKEKCSLFNTNIFNFKDLNTENGPEKKLTVKKLSFLDNKPVEFDVLSKIHANNKNGPSITILKWTLDMQPLPVYHFKKWPDGPFILFN